MDRRLGHLVFSLFIHWSLIKLSHVLSVQYVRGLDMHFDHNRALACCSFKQACAVPLSPRGTWRSSSQSIVVVQDQGLRAIEA